MARAAASPRSSQPAPDQGVGDRREKLFGGGLVDQQGFGRAAGPTHPPQLGVDDDVDGLLHVGGRVDEDVVETFQVAQHRGAGFGLDAGDQALAAAWDDQVDGLVQAREEGADGGAVGGLDDLDGGGGKASGLQTAFYRSVKRQVGVDALRPAAQDHRIARAHAQRRGVGGHVRAAFIDHGDDADRGADAADVQAIGPGPAGGGDADRIGDGGHGLDPGGDLFQPRLVQGQAIQHRT